MLTSRTRTRLLNSLPTKPCSCPGTLRLPRGALAGGLSRFLLLPLREDLETYEGAFTIFLRFGVPLEARRGLEVAVHRVRV